MKHFWGRSNARKIRTWASVFALSVAMTIAPRLLAQTGSGISGTITDASGGVIQNAVVVLTDKETAVTQQTKTSAAGIYSFPSIATGTYSLQVTYPGYKSLEQNGISVTLNQQIRLDEVLAVGGETQTVEVNSDGAALNRDNGTIQFTVDPTVVIQLPLVVSGAVRNSSDFLQIMPGVNSTGGTATANLRINGGQAGDGDSTVDGVSMQEGGESQSGLIALSDNPLTPDMVSELNVLTSNYEPQYGNANSGSIVQEFRSGTDKFHGAAWEYARNTVFDSVQWTGQATPEGFKKPEDNQHDFGARVGGPIPVKYLTSGDSKTFFFGLFERFRQVGGVSSSVFSLPTKLEQTGDFSDWGAPIYDPATTKVGIGEDGKLLVTRSQFMGCDGTHPNVICNTDPRFTNSYAQAFLKYIAPLPLINTNTNNNYRAKPIPGGVTAGDRNYYLGKIDHYRGEKEHFSTAIYYWNAPVQINNQLPVQIDTNGYNVSLHSWLIRGAWDHTFSPTLLNHFGFGYQNIVQESASINYTYAKDFPQLPAPLDTTVQVPQIAFGDNYSGLGSSNGAPSTSGRPAYIYNDMATWVLGKHTLKIGGEFRWLANDIRSTSDRGGVFNFDRKQTGVTGFGQPAASGNAWASFILEQVQSGKFNQYKVPETFTRQYFYTIYAGDTWKATNKLSVNYGLRYDRDTPTHEKNDNLSFFDINGANPGAGGRPGREAWAGHKWGAASYGKRYPENNFWKAFSPRVGLAYSVDSKTVVRAGYGIFFNQAYYDGWGGGQALDGLNSEQDANASGNGYDPSFILSSGFPAAALKSTVISSTLSNGNRVPNFRNLTGNNQGYTQQWNATWERQLIKDTSVGITYIGNKGTHLHSQIDGINALDPGYLATPLGPLLSQTFAPGQAQLDGVNSPYGATGGPPYGPNGPYADWATQLGSGATLAQALLPYPQYRGGGDLAVNENQGGSTYHALQLKADKHFSSGLYFLVNYTWSKTLGNTGFVDESENAWFSNGFGSAISPYERKRNKSIEPDDITHVFHAGYVADIPVGKGKLLNVSNPILNEIVGGWQTSGIIRVAGGTPLWFRSGNCTVPSELEVHCIPSQIPGVRPFLQNKNHFNPNLPVLNQAAFELPTVFNNPLYYGHGPRTTGLRGPDYKDVDMAVTKTFPIKERFSFEFRVDAFNAFNNHYFDSSGFRGGLPFQTDINANYQPDPSKPQTSTFGTWGGGVTAPRQFQLSGRFEF